MGSFQGRSTVHMYTQHYANTNPLLNQQQSYMNVSRRKRSSSTPDNRDNREFGAYVCLTHLLATPQLPRLGSLKKDERGYSSCRYWRNMLLLLLGVMIISPLMITDETGDGKDQPDPDPQPDPNNNTTINDLVRSWY